MCPLLYFILCQGKVHNSQHRQEQPQQNTQKRTSKNKLGLFMHTVQIEEVVKGKNKKNILLSFDSKWIEQVHPSETFFTAAFSMNRDGG